MISLADTDGTPEKAQGTVTLIRQIGKNRCLLNFKYPLLLFKNYSRLQQYKDNHALYSCGLERHRRIGSQLDKSKL